MIGKEDPKLAVKLASLELTLNKIKEGTSDKLTIHLVSELSRLQFMIS